MLQTDYREIYILLLGKIYKVYNIYGNFSNIGLLATIPFYGSILVKHMLVYSFSCDRYTRASNFHSHLTFVIHCTLPFYSLAVIHKCTDIHGTFEYHVFKAGS